MKKSIWLIVSTSVILLMSCQMAVQRKTKVLTVVPTIIPSLTRMPSGLILPTIAPMPIPTATGTFFVYPCQEPGFPGTIHYANTDSFGDGYIALVAKESMEDKSDDEIVMILVTQWLEHYKTSSLSASASIKDYKVEKITLIDPSCDPFFTIVAAVRFSVIPSQVPHEMGSIPGEEDGEWWHLSAPFGVFVDGSNYRLRLVFGWGT